MTFILKIKEKKSPQKHWFNSLSEQSSRADQQYKKLGTFFALLSSYFNSLPQIGIFGNLTYFLCYSLFWWKVQATLIVTDCHSPLWPWTKTVKFILGVYVPLSAKSNSVPTQQDWIQSSKPQNWKSIRYILRRSIQKKKIANSLSSRTTCAFLKTR